MAAAQFQETLTFLNGVRDALASHGVVNMAAVEFGRRAALLKDGAGLLASLYQGKGLTVPGDASQPGGGQGGV